jgi:hypothetical protein
LGNVVTSLARAVEEAGHCVEVILPKYNNLDYSQVKPPRYPAAHDRLSMMPNSGCSFFCCLNFRASWQLVQYAHLNAKR